MGNRQPKERGDARRGEHGHQRRGEDPQPLGSQPGPRQQDHDRQSPDEGGCDPSRRPAGVDGPQQRRRQRDQVDHAVSPSPIPEQGVRLSGGDDEADPGQHPVHDRRGHRLEPTPRPEHASGYLEQPGNEDHHRQEAQGRAAGRARGR
jgi:hypothetical protein